MVTLPPIAETIYLSVDKAIHGLCPLDRPQETPRVSWVDGPCILLGQTCSTVCQGARQRDGGQRPRLGGAGASHDRESRQDRDGLAARAGDGKHGVRSLARRGESAVRDCRYRNGEKAQG